MKTKLFFYLLFSAFFAKAQYVTIPDSNFRKALNELYPDCFNQTLLDTNCASTKNKAMQFGLKYISSLEGIQYFKSVTYVDVSANNLSSLPPLPNTIRQLYCYYNDLTILPKLPDSLKILDCSQNKLQHIPSLPNGLMNLESCQNLLIDLPSIPNNLLSLSCWQNSLINMPILPLGLEELVCYDNPSLACLPFLPNSLTKLYVFNTKINCLPNIPKGMDGQTQILPICNSTNNSNNCQLTTNVQDDYLLNDAIISYPNPVENGRLFISNAQGLKYKLNSTQGQLMMNGTLDETGLDVSQLNPGMYMLEIGANENKKVEKIVIR